MSDEVDSFDKLNQEFSKYLRQLKKENAFQSIYLLSEAYVSIVNQFNVNADEYLYYLEKFRTSSRSEYDLSQTEIVLYLKGIIEHLERIFSKKIDISSLSLISQKSIEIESDSEVEGAIYDKTPQITNDFSNLNQQTADVNEVKYREIDLSNSQPNSTDSPTLSPSQEGIIQDIKQYPELVEIYHETVGHDNHVSHEDWEEISMDPVNELLTPSISKGDSELNAIINSLGSAPQSEGKTGNHISPIPEYKVVKSLKTFGFSDLIPLFNPKK